MPESTKNVSASAIAIGCSAGGVDALRIILSRLPSDFPYPLFITIHRDEKQAGRLEELLNCNSGIRLVSPEDKEKILPNCAYIAPGDYHLQIERDFRLSLSVDPPVHHCRPSIDVMFETAAWAYGNQLVGIILTGANEDGSLGLKTIKEWGGRTLVESPATAQFPMMPEAAIKAAPVDHIFSLEEITGYLQSLCD